MKRLEKYIDQDGEKLRLGYTTGSTATGATKAALKALLDQESFDEIDIETPAGIDLSLGVNSLEFTEDYGQASVIKDGGDDIDNTDGIEIFSKVRLNNQGLINITGGPGIGKITKKGIYGEIGDYAINPVPKEMIKKEIRKLTDEGVDVEIFAPAGLEVSKRTYNKNIGIVGGISIIGTKGIVYPKSEEAYIKTIYLEIDSIKKNIGTDTVLVLTPGNYGEDYAEKKLNYKNAVQVSNFMGKALKYSYNQGFRKFYLIGHVGKFSKLALGIFNTHNEIADTRMESFVYYMAMRNVDHRHYSKVMEIMSAEEAMEYVINNNLTYVLKDMEKGAESRIKKYLKDDDVEIQVKIYSMKRGADF